MQTYPHLADAIFTVRNVRTQKFIGEQRSVVTLNTTVFINGEVLQGNIPCVCGTLLIFCNMQLTIVVIVVRLTSLNWKQTTNLVLSDVDMRMSLCTQHFYYYSTRKQRFCIWQPLHSMKDKSILIIITIIIMTWSD